MSDALIESLGAQGDGVFSENGRDIYVPFVLPKETVVIKGKGARRELETLVQPSEKRIPPICPKFGTCGGCQLQHLAHEEYQNWKMDLLKTALARQGIVREPEQMVTFPAAGRRKVVFSACRQGGRLKLGFAQLHSNEIVDLAHCPVLEPELNAAFPQILELAAMLPLGKQPVRLSVLRSENGIDLAIEGIRNPDTGFRQALVQKALALDLARLSADDEILVEKRKPVLTMGKAKVVPPPASFVQANALAEAALADRVQRHLECCKSVVDLYSGVGTFALRLAENSKVWALEQSRPAIDALDKAWRNTAGSLKQVTSEVRNLDRRPVNVKELKKHDGLVFDPPRAGAERQCRQIAKSSVSRVAAVSCNPTTLARDLKILMDGGYDILSITAVDQFRFSPHLEVVVLLEKYQTRIC